MKVGTLCRVVVRHTHTTDHFGDLVVVLQAGNIRPHLICFNPRTAKQHHYREDELEVICK